MSLISSPTTCTNLATTIRDLLLLTHKTATAAVLGDLDPVAHPDPHMPPLVPVHPPPAQHAACRGLGVRVMMDARLAGALLAHTLISLSEKPFRQAGGGDGAQQVGVW